MRIASVPAVVYKEMSASLKHIWPTAYMVEENLSLMYV